MTPRHLLELITVEGLAGTNIETVVFEMIQLAKARNGIVSCDVNGFSLRCHPWDYSDMKVAEYRKWLREK